ncbi:hypothetical protein CONPUDRAFT_170028 [Coniophora puteana RWD-64-598 SS2]|uniref:Uncharacterized protein n=1 Tax=Coniophora puteana (strain RWD-64-598) TaxID=741705 RepID=R7SG45_CONPW|nr:uncharacterized protein CONPUDRAFT_170028 [Coniophora puteana RWD-64-598 SS2]EIW74692.1 hypothetical protein CONPUDRAFT_170028 [Coniophora puteana RWD-64-598 SS2]
MAIDLLLPMPSGLPPAYEAEGPRSPIPDYSPKPLPGEKSMQKTPKNSRCSETGGQNNCTFTYRQDGTTLTLRNCREEDELPTFRFRGMVSGEVDIEDRERVSSVSVKLEGRVSLRGMEATERRLFMREHTLWNLRDSMNCDSSSLSSSSSSGESDDDQHPQQCFPRSRRDSRLGLQQQQQQQQQAQPLCPSMFPFAIAFPSTFREERDGRTSKASPLPPSCEVMRPMRAHVVYVLSVHIVRARKVPFLGAWLPNRDERLLAQLNYRPRVRPPRPMPMSMVMAMANLGGSSFEKSCPEDWHMALWKTKIPVKAASGAPSKTEIDADCHIQLPASRVYLVTDPIPFRVRLEVPKDQWSEALREQLVGGGKPPLNTFLLRQTVLNQHGSRHVGDVVLGTAGRTTPSPEVESDSETESGESLSPSYYESDVESPPSPAQWSNMTVMVEQKHDCWSVEWSGVLRCDSEIEHTGFITTEFSVNDFVVLSWDEPGPLRNRKASVNHAIAIRLVVDPWTSRHCVPWNTEM